MNITLKRVFVFLFLVGIAACILVFGIDFYVRNSTQKQIVSSPNGEYDCILVLGAGVRGNRPSPMLQDRLDYAIDLYNQGKAPKLLMSGDHGQTDYDEVNIMKAYAIEKGIPSEDIFMDHAGFSTYESIYRAKQVFEAEKIIIVTQEYHLFRALYVANALEVDAVGYASDPREYAGQEYRELREILARGKDFVYCIFKPEPKYLGPSIAVSGNGDVTNDK
ncbi:MAG: YdcF family protein [Clostridia bacterium]|nr:YdcF family protein [Clostridia bacterium]